MSYYQPKTYRFCVIGDKSSTDYAVNRTWFISTDRQEALAKAQQHAMSLLRNKTRREPQTPLLVVEVVSVVGSLPGDNK